jgi:hypothetical protein
MKNLYPEELLEIINTKAKPHPSNLTKLEMFMIF